jgi:hypothetical protein
MRHLFPGRIILGLAFLSGLSACGALAEPPGKDKGPKGPPPDAESVFVRGTVKEFTTAPKGETDGLILTDGTVVHWPPHMADRFTDIVAKGDKVKVVGFKETDPRGETKIEVSSLTNLGTDKTSENPDRRVNARRGPGPRETRTVSGTVRSFTTAPKGEVDGAELEDGTVIHWPPHLADRFTNIIAKGDKVKVVGFQETGPKGDAKLEVSSITNVRTDKTSENPDHPPAGPGKGGDKKERLRQLEIQVEQLQKEIQRLRRER